MAENQTVIKPQRGGAREGAGRKRLDINARWMRARGIHPLTAAEILAQVQDERRLWRRILTSEDDRVVLQAMMFLTSMRDGKPAQQINVTSTTITLKPADIERARAIAREIRQDMREPLALASCNNAQPTSPLQVDVPAAAPIAAQEGAEEGRRKGEPMLCDDEGGEKGGRGDGEGRD